MVGDLLPYSSLQKKLRSGIVKNLNSALLGTCYWASRCYDSVGIFEDEIATFPDLKTKLIQKIWIAFDVLNISHDHMTITILCVISRSN